MSLPFAKKIYKARPSFLMTKPKPRTILPVEDGMFQEKYSMGDKVVDKPHRHMEVRYATRNADNFEVMVKIRYKPACFISRTEEREWRQTTEFMLNMPPCDGVAQLYEVCEDSEALYIVTELAPGMDLSELLDSEAVTFTVDNVREIIKPILEALEHMHENNAVHKDLKLENVVVDARKDEMTLPNWSPKTVKIIDFDTVVEWCPKSPKAKDVLGTDQYIAQEAYDGAYSPCSDVFAIGVLMYRLATGGFPFHPEIFDDRPGENWVGSPKMKQIRNRLQKEKINWGQSCFEQNPALGLLCARMLAHDTAERPSAKEALMSEFFGGPGLPKVSPKVVCVAKAQESRSPCGSPTGAKSPLAGIITNMMQRLSGVQRSMNKRKRSLKGLVEFKGV